MNARDQNGPVSKLATCLMQAVLAAVTSKEDTVESFEHTFQSLIALLSNEVEEDSGRKVSIPVVRTVAQFAKKNIKVALPKLFALLQSESFSERLHVIAVLSHLVRFGEERHCIAEQLYCCLSDDNVYVRSAAEKGLVHIDAEWLVPRLCEKLKGNEVKERSATTGMKSLSMERYKVQLEDSKKNILVKAGNMLKSEGGEGKNIEPAWHERIFQLLPQWSSTMSLSTFDSVTTVLAKKALETPRDPLVIKILRLIGKGIDNGRDAIQKSHYGGKIFTTVTNAMKVQTKPSKADIEFVKLNDTSSLGEEKEFDLLFQRLNAVLIVKSLPFSLFKKESITKKLAEMLLERMFPMDGYEFDEVRRQSAEVFARLPSDYISPILFSYINIDNFINTKTAVYSLCHCITVWKDNLERKVLQSVFEKIIKLLQSTSAIHKDGKEKDIALLERGCCECLALLIRVEMECKKIPEYSISISSKVLASLGDKNECISVRILVANALITSLTRKFVWDECKIVHVWPSHLIQIVKMEKNDTIRASCFRIMFTLLYHSNDSNRSKEYACECCPEIFKSLHSNSTIEVEESLKFLAFILTMPKTLDDVPSGAIGSALRIVRGISNMGSRKEIRKLAEETVEILECYNKGI
eukprot:g648.t1